MSDALKPLASKDGDPIFEAAWQAEVLGIADLLVKNHVFSANEWADTLGKNVRKEADTTTGYYSAVLKSVEQLLENSGVRTTELDQMRDAWHAAYKATPHGEPVELG